MVSTVAGFVETRFRGEEKKKAEVEIQPNKPTTISSLSVAAFWLVVADEATQLLLLQGCCVSVLLLFFFLSIVSFSLPRTAQMGGGFLF